MNLYRQGDLQIRKISKLPRGLKRKKDTIIAYGEATGHNHQLLPTTQEFAHDLEIYLDNLTKAVYFKTKGAKLVHQEHKTIEIDEGIWSMGCPPP